MKKKIKLFSGLRDGRKIVPFLAPAVLCLIALHHFGQVWWSELSPWKGGGFGMFSTIESPSSRIIRVYLIANGTRIPVKVPGRFSKLTSALKTNPTHSNASHLARELGQGIWSTYTIVPVQQQYLDLRSSYFKDDILLDTSFTISANSTYLNSLMEEMAWVKWVERTEPVEHPVNFDQVEVVCYQLKFVADAGKLVLNPIATAREDGHGK